VTPGAGLRPPGAGSRYTAHLELTDADVERLLREVGGARRLIRGRLRAESRVRSVTGELGSGHGLFWFRGDGRGGWRLMPRSGLPDRGLAIPHGVALADLDGDGVPEIIALHGGAGNITIWKRR
jgi:hypothetical protein